MGIWGCGLLVASLVLPKTLPSRSRFSGPVGWRDVMPSYGDYRKTFALLATPAVGLIVLISMLNLTGGAIQFSFFVVYLDSLEMPGTLIGFIMSSYSVMAALGALATGRLARHFSSHWLLYVMVVISVIGLMCTPLLTTFVALIVMTMARGFAQGIGQPLMISTASRVTDPGEQGRSVGLRVTANRLTLTITPMVMGAVIELVGLNTSFWVMGGALLVALAGAAVAMVVTRAFDEPS
jgi:predicted MFS family arabinose efflux permease